MKTLSSGWPITTHDMHTVRGISVHSGVLQGRRIGAEWRVTRKTYRCRVTCYKKDVSVQSGASSHPSFLSNASLSHFCAAISSANLAFNDAFSYCNSCSKTRHDLHATTRSSWWHCRRRYHLTSNLLRHYLAKFHSQVHDFRANLFLFVKSFTHTVYSKCLSESSRIHSNVYANKLTAACSKCLRISILWSPSQALNKLVIYCGPNGRPNKPPPPLAWLNQQRCGCSWLMALLHCQSSQATARSVRTDSRQMKTCIRLSRFTVTLKVTGYINMIRNRS